MQLAPQEVSAINHSEDPNRQRKTPDDFLQDYVDMQHTFKSLTIIDQILMSMEEKDKRRPLLYQLRRQLQEDEITFEEARRAIVEMEAAGQAVCLTSHYHNDAVERFVNKKPLRFNWEVN